jgi:hypothetical protein
MRVMMKYLQIVLIFVLMLSCSYLYFDRNNAVASFHKRIAVLEAAGKKYQEDCETRIAYLREDKDRLLTSKKTQPEIPSLRDIVEKLPTNPERVQKDTFIELSAALNLSEKQERKVRDVFSDFVKAKDLIFEKCAREKIFFLDPARRNMINEARRDAMGKLGAILTAEQLKEFKDNDFDLKLGLREMENAVNAVR